MFKLVFESVLRNFSAKVSDMESDIVGDLLTAIVTR